MLKLLIIVGFATLVKSHDVIIGATAEGKKIFDENRIANPHLLWKQVQNVTISAAEDEVISKIFVTDLRPEKDGDVRIVEGGQGQKNVTLELKSPTVLRGYEFHVEVYSAPEDKTKITTTTQKIDFLHPSQTRRERKTDEDKNDKANFNPPTPTFKDGKSNLFPSMSTDTKINYGKETIDANAENVHKINDNTSEATPNDKSKNSDDMNDFKYGPRHVRESAEEHDEKSKVPKAPHHEIDTAKISPQHPIVTPKQKHAENPEEDKMSTDEISAANESKRDARDTEPKENTGSLTTIKSENSNQHDKNAPPTQTIRIPTATPDYKREVSFNPKTNNYPEINPTILPVGFGKTDTKNTDTNDKDRSVRDTEEKLKLSPTIFTSDDTKLRMDTEKQNSEKKVTVIPMVDQKQNPHIEGAKVTTEQNIVNTARAFTPIPYSNSFSTTTEKYQNKRDTEPKVSENGKEAGSKNTPQTYGRQTFNHEQKPVISIQ